jgi:hypothetical protein
LNAIQDFLTCLLSRNCANNDNSNIENQPYHTLALPETVARYCKRLTGLYSIVLRSATNTLPNNIPFQISPDQRQAALKVVDALRRNSNVQPALHKLGMSLFAPAVETDANDQYSCPVMRFLVYTHLSIEGQFSHVSLVPPSISELQRALRYVLFKEMMDTQPNYPGDNLGYVICI